ncbi:hypothetical protein CVT26_012337 [Gymnopilus dilepis]|uniref:Uncharacterized protein n=1 Tax=Gymnopilus dilepis TaxID=231916 RepID=A0A409YCB0_9AGAR|nr:hypothetical protein CVT26_012337 [Gymnopilus dilepis]
MTTQLEEISQEVRGQGHQMRYRRSKNAIVRQAESSSLFSPAGINPYYSVSDPFASRVARRAPLERRVVEQGEVKVRRLQFGFSIE